MWTNIFVFALCALVYAAAWWLVASGVLGAWRAQTDDLRTDGYLADAETSAEELEPDVPAAAWQDESDVLAEELPSDEVSAHAAFAETSSDVTSHASGHAAPRELAPEPAEAPFHASAPPDDDFGARLDAGDLAAASERAAAESETNSRSSSAPTAPDDETRESEVAPSEPVADFSASAARPAAGTPRASGDAQAPPGDAAESDEVGTSETPHAQRDDRTSSPHPQQGHEDMNSQPLDLPNWMEDTSSGAQARTTEPASLVPAAPTTPAASSTPNAALPSKPAATETPRATSSASPRSGNDKAAASTLEPLRQLSKIEKERMQCMSQLDTWARTWAEIEQRNAQVCDELTRQVDSLAQEHSSCDQRQREAETRAKQETARQTSELLQLRSKVGELEPYVQQCLDLRQKCDGLGQDMKSAQQAIDEHKQSAHTSMERNQTLSAELEKLRDQFARNQEAFKEATARELDWQKRYHEDTNKLMAQLTQKSQEHERAQGENQKAKAEMERSRQEHAAKDLSLQQSAQKYTELEQHCHAQEDALHEREERIQALMAELEQMRTAAALQKKAQEENMAMFHAAQSVLAELKPKLQMLENNLTPHS